MPVRCTVHSTSSGHRWFQWGAWCSMHDFSAKRAASIAVVKAMSASCGREGDERNDHVWQATSAQPLGARTICFLKAFTMISIVLV